MELIRAVVRSSRNRERSLVVAWTVLVASILISLLAASSDASAEEVTGSVTPTEAGAAKTVTFSAPGDTAALSVPVAAGELISMVSSEAGLSGTYRLEWLNPEGESMRAWSPPGEADSFFEPVQFEEAGEATLLVHPEGSAIGSITFTLYDASDRTSSISLAGGGETKTLTIRAPGQRHLVHFDGTKGQTVALVPSGADFEGEFEVNTPAGVLLEGSGGTLEGMHGPLNLPETGIYTLVLTGEGAQTGRVSLDFQDSAMVVAYGFDEGKGDEVRDGSGLGHTGEIEGATWAEPAGPSGHSLDFDGEEGCLTVHDSTGIDLQHAFTVDAWIRPEALWEKEEEDWTIFEVPATETSPALALVVNRASEGILEAVVGEDSLGEFAVASDPEEVEWYRWQYVAMTFDGADLKVYVGSELVGQATVNTPAVGAGSMTVGCSRTTPNIFGGGIDEFRVYTRALSSGEIASDESTPVQPVHVDVYGQLASVPEGGLVGIQGGSYVRAGAKGEAEIEGLELKVDGEPVKSMTRAEALEDHGFEYCSEGLCYLGYEYGSIFPPGISAGEHTVSIVATGDHGREATFDKTVKVDAAPPVIHLSGRLFEDGGVATEEPEELSASATDEGVGDSGIEYIFFRVDGEWQRAEWAACEGGCGGHLEASYSYSAKEWANEPHELTITAVDAAGNETTKTLTVERSTEAVELQVTGQLGEAAEGGMVGIQEGLPVRAVAKGEAEIEGFELKVDGEQVAAETRTEVLEGGGTELCGETECHLSYEFKSIFPSALPSGLHTVSVIAFSHHGRKSLYKKTVRVDADPPVLHLSGKLHEEAGLLTEESEELATSATDGEGENSSGIKSVAIYVDDALAKGSTSACEGGCGSSLGTSYTYSQREWGGNPHELTVTAVDGAGNKTTDTFTVEQPAPTVKPECGPSECTDLWTGPAAGSWSTARYWSAEHVPTASDVVYIGAGKSVSVDGASSAASVHVGGTLSVQSERSLELSSPTETSIVNDLIGEFCTLSGPGDITVDGSVHWTFATMSGSGATLLASSAVAQLQGLTLKGRTFTNEATVNSTSGIEMSEGAIFRNEGVFTYPGSIISGGSDTDFVNTGILTNGSGSSSWGFVDVPFVNEGTVEARSKPMVFGKAAMISRGGDWIAAEGGELTFWKGTFEAVGGSLSGEVLALAEEVKLEGGVRTAGLSLTVTGEKEYPFNGDEEGESTVEVDQLDLSLPDLTLSSAATLTGPGDVYISRSLYWYYGAIMEGTGRVTLLPGAIAPAELLGPVSDNPTLKQTFVNEGTFELNNNSSMRLESNAIFDNLGTFIYSSRQLNRPFASNEIPYEGGESAMFVNAGTFENTSYAGTLVVGVPFANEGTIKMAWEEDVIIQHPIALKSSEHAPEEACGKAGDPVACATGNFTEAQADLEVGGRGVGLDLTRTYSAQAAAGGSVGIFGYGWNNSFGDHLAAGEAGTRETLTEASGGTVPFARSGAAYVAPSWSQDVLTGSAQVGFTLTLPDQTIERFSGSGRLESLTDRNGNATTLSYDGSGELETITDPSGRTITLAYDAEGLVEEATDPMGHVVRYAYESKNLQSVTLPGETSPNWQFKYDGSHRMTSMTDGRGGKTSNEYDSSNRVVSQTDPAGRTLLWKYEPFHTTITNEATGAVTDEWFNSKNQPCSITRGYGTASAATETFAYTAAGLLASRTDGDDHTTTYGYDGEGNRTNERDAEGDETRWTYDEAHEVTSETKPNGEKATITLDANGSPETVSRPAPASKTQTVFYEYGPHGEVKSLTDPLGRARSYEYDKYGDRTAEIDPEGDKQTWAYNEDSQVASKVSPRGNEEGAEATKFTTTIERDAQGRPIKVTDPLAGTTKFAYDADGNVESIIDPNGHKTKFTYDADNERTKVERPNGTVEETGYDGAGQITSQADGDKHKTTYVRNLLEQPIEVIDPLERKSVQTFDATGNLKTKTDPDSRTTTFGYDKADRLKEIAYSAEASQDVTFGYNEDGEPITMKDGTGESTWEYDQLGRLIHAKSGHGETESWAYNLDDEPVGLTYPNGESISRAYDKAGRLESVTDWLGHTTSFAYNRDSEPTATTFPVGTSDKDEYGYDRADRMASVTMKKGVETLASLAYSRDPMGQLESLISKGLASTEEESFTYDENERVTKIDAAEFGYDAANNITKAPGTTNVYDKASQIESATGANFTFDKEGERTKETSGSGPATTYKYDQAGDLATIERAEEGETPAIAESFGYGGTGLLASRTVGPSTAHFVWDLSESPELLLSDGENSYVYGPGGLAVESISAGEVPTYLHHDQLGSTRILTNSSGKVAGTFTYGAYGGLSGHTGTATTALGYAGQYTLAQSGLQYLRARFYDPGTAQFMTRDPIESITRSPYGYAKQNPVGRIDPSGLCGVSSVGGFLESINPISEENCAYEAASSASAAVSNISLPSIRDAAEAEVGFFDGATVGLTKYAREIFGIGNGGLALCGSVYDDAGDVGAIFGGLIAVYTPDGALEVASRFPRASRWLAEHGDEATQIKDIFEEVIRHTVGK